MTQAPSAPRTRAAATRAASCAAVPNSWGSLPDAVHQRLQPLRRHRSNVLLQMALLSTVCLAAGLGAGWSGVLPRRQLSPLATSFPASRSVSAAATTAREASTSPASSPGAAAVFTVVAPLQLQSPFGVSWREVLEHTATRLSWTDPAFRLSLHDSQLLAGGDEGASSSRSALLDDVRQSQAAVAIGVADMTSAAALAPLLAEATTAVALGSAQQLQAATRLGGRTPGGSLGFLQRLFGGTQADVDEQVLHTIAELYQRASSDDFLFVFLVLANSYIKEVPAVAMSFAQKNAGLQELQCMVTKCGGQIFRCVTDTSCKAALDCLTGCEFNDQVCTYRCITSYESPLLEDFSLCIIQKHNCFNLKADIPMVPDPAPLASFGGQPMTHELAEDLFIGWLDADSTTSLDRPSALQPFSWRVFAGKNAAYDFFNCQYQLFYRGKGKGGMWYDPSFKVETVDGRSVWRRRHYRVKRDKQPGTFRFSVLDNGVTSNEFWRILDCEEGLDWCVFYYSGAASRAGLSYSGAILASKSGEWPKSQAARQRIEAVLDSAGIKTWELSNVDNSNCVGAPLDRSLLALA
ncbi:hypothetical protein D9Q98_008313 [Chlorella vulgaris]|uniref:VDE lipocalin domain-containing protein n=1 Tax=Chlorella vulgaris TaxID=3077 RepID=A0A9D4YTA3_CHLVU|nr:hypothetical protein D9Q98_008313 [Chlorella vulgaris]